MNRCPISYNPCGDNRYSDAGLRLLSAELASLKDLEYTAEEQRKEAYNRASKMSIQGIQPKLSAKLNIKVLTWVEDLFSNLSMNIFQRCQKMRT